MKPPRPSRAARLEAIQIRIDNAGDYIFDSRRSFHSALRRSAHASTRERLGEVLPEFDAAIEQAADSLASARAEMHFALTGIRKLRPTWRTGI